MEKRQSMSWARYILLLKTLNMSTLGRDGGYLVPPVKSLLFAVDLQPEVKSILYILKHNPQLFLLLFKKSKLSPQRYKNSQYWYSWWTVHLTPQATQASDHYHQPSLLWGNNAKWPPVLSAADCKYLKEINFSEWKAPFFVLQPPFLPSHVDFGAVHTASTCTFQLFACQHHCGFLAWV